MTEKTKYYPEIQAKADFPALEQEILNYWAKFNQNIRFMPIMP